MSVDVSQAAHAKIDVTRYRNEFSFRHKLARVCWNVVWLLLFRPSPRLLFGWRNLLLRLFGAKVGKGCAVHPSCRIWAPWNLHMGEKTCLSFDVDCYCVDKITLGNHVTVSQYAYLCSGSHDIGDPHMGLVTAPITVADGAWVCAGAFVAPGVSLGAGAVAAARAVVVKNVDPWTVVGGNPARPIKQRSLRQ